MVTSKEIITLASSTGHCHSIFGQVNNYLGTTVNAYLMQCLLAIAFILIGNLENLITIYTTPSFIFYGACALVLIIARIKYPHIPRPYRVWITTPIFFIIACLWLIVTTAIYNLKYFGISVGIMFSGVPVYFIAKNIFGVHIYTNFEQNLPNAKGKIPTSPECTDTPSLDEKTTFGST
jgi:amino acid transporter